MTQPAPWEPDTSHARIPADAAEALLMLPDSWIELI